MGISYIILIEQEKDYRRVEESTKLAFSYPGRIERGQIGCPFEHWMVHELRKRDGILSLSLVAEVNGSIVGHIICSESVVKTANKTLPVLNFGPLSVLPEYQRKGIGGTLLKAMIKEARFFMFYQGKLYVILFRIKECINV